MRETQGGHGIAGGALLFCGGMLIFVLALYFGIAFAYTSYVNSQITSLKQEISTANQSVSPAKEQQIIDFYSQTSNLKTILAGHVHTSQFLQWLGNNTEANIYYQSLDLTAGYKATLKGIAKTEGDINQQIAIFESTSTVESVVVSSVAVAQPQPGTSVTSPGVSFTLTLTMLPSLFTSITQ